MNTLLTLLTESELNADTFRFCHQCNAFRKKDVPPFPPRTTERVPVFFPSYCVGGVLIFRGNKCSVLLLYSPFGSSSSSNRLKRNKRVHEKGRRGWGSYTRITVGMPCPTPFLRVYLVLELSIFPLFKKKSHWGWEHLCCSCKSSSILLREGISLNHWVEGQWILYQIQVELPPKSVPRCLTVCLRGNPTGQSRQI